VFRYAHQIRKDCIESGKYLAYSVQREVGIRKLGFTKWRTGGKIEDRRRRTSDGRGDSWAHSRGASVSTHRLAAASRRVYPDGITFPRRDIRFRDLAGMEGVFRQCTKSTFSRNGCYPGHRRGPPLIAAVPPGGSLGQSLAGSMCRYRCPQRGKEKLISTASWRLSIPILMDDGVLTTDE